MTVVWAVLAGPAFAEDGPRARFAPDSYVEKPLAPDAPLDPNSATMVATLKAEFDDLENVVSVLKLLGMVNAAPGFDQLPAVINGCSDLFLEVFGEKVGRHARSAVGMAELPFGMAVEIEAVVAVR